MITVFTQVSSHKYSDIIQSTHRLRYRAFVQRMGWSVPRWNGMEYDQYDNLSTVYLVWRDRQAVVRGTCRLAPTDRPYMLKDIWPHIVTKVPLPCSPYVFEASRLCVEHHLPAELRRQIISELVCSYQQIGLLNELDYMVGVMPPNIWRHVFANSGWEIEFIGPETVLDTGEIIVAGKMNLSPDILDNILRVTGLEAPPLHLSPELGSIVGEAVLSEDRHKESAEMPALATSACGDATEVDNLICCLEFLADEARTAGLENIQAIIRHSIHEIARTYETSSGRKPMPHSTDVLQAFRVLARFCLIDDPGAKQQIVRLIEAIDRETLANYAH